MNGKSDFYYSDSHDNKSSSYTLANLVIGYEKDQWNYEFWLEIFLTSIIRSEVLF